MYERLPTKEQAELAQRLMLPSTFFVYKDVPGYVSDASDGKYLSFYLLVCSATNVKSGYIYSMHAML